MDTHSTPTKPGAIGQTESPISRIISSAIAAGRVILRQRSSRSRETAIDPDLLLQLCADLVEHRGEASGLALAEQILSAYTALTPEEQYLFFEGLARDFLVDQTRLTESIEQYANSAAPEQLIELRKAVEPRCNRLFRRLNMVPDVTGLLVRMRGDLLGHGLNSPELKALNDEMKRLLRIWFNVGFLSLRRISWDSPASILEKFIEYEAVHEIQGWRDLRGRLKEDRRLFAYFHPTMPGDPIIFVQVALKHGSSNAIGPLVGPERSTEDPAQCDTATFYSISNCHKGLQGISFGNFLIKQVASELRAEFPNLRRFETLSPVPGFRSWLSKVLAGSIANTLPTAILEPLRSDSEDIEQESETNPVLQETLIMLCAHYLVHEKRGALPLDPVAKFHLSNGALLDRIHWQGDTSEAGKKRSYGIMVNYVYEPDEIENRHEAYITEGRIATSTSVQELADSLS